MFNWTDDEEVLGRLEPHQNEADKKFREQIETFRGNKQALIELHKNVRFLNLEFFCEIL